MYPHQSDGCLSEHDNLNDKQFPPKRSAGNRSFVGTVTLTGMTRGASGKGIKPSRPRGVHVIRCSCFKLLWLLIKTNKRISMSLMLKCNVMLS